MKFIVNQQDFQLALNFCQGVSFLSTLNLLFMCASANVFRRSIIAVMDAKDHTPDITTNPEIPYNNNNPSAGLSIAFLHLSALASSTLHRA